MLEALRRAHEKLQRDSNLSWQRLAQKSVRYIQEMATAPVYLRHVTHVGQGVRTLGRPRIENLGTMSLGAGTLVRSINVPVELATAEGATLRIGAEVRLNYGTSIGCTGRITLGDRVRVGPYVMIVDNDFHDIYDRNIRPKPRPVVIEDDVWLGAKVCVLPGVTIGRGAIIGTGAVVNRDVPAFSIYAGVPAKLVKQLDPNRFVAEKRRT
jgi:maltose O-acetyltransferase